MSYFIFGAFNSDYFLLNCKKLKLIAQQRGAYFWFNDEINYYQEIFTMCKEQHSNESIIYAITSENQPKNSSDLLFPYNKYSNEELFSVKLGRNYEQLCAENLAILFDCLQCFCNMFKPVSLDIFVVEGYDTNFKKKTCTLKTMKNDIIAQLKDSDYLESSIYRITEDIAATNY